MSRLCTVLLIAVASTAILSARDGGQSEVGSAAVTCWESLLNAVSTAQLERKSEYYSSRDQKSLALNRMDRQKRVASAGNGSLSLNEVEDFETRANGGHPAAQ